MSSTHYLLHFRNRTLAKLTYYSPLYFYRKSKHEETFTLNGEEYKYLFNHQTWRFERAVEIGIMQKYIRQFEGKRILEIGNTIQFYAPFPHTIIDKYDKRLGSIEIDLFKFNPPEKFDLIFSVSTFEHIGWDEKPRIHNQFLPAIEKTKSLLRKGGVFVFTIPIGYNGEIDALIRAGKLGFERHYLKRINSLNEWRETSEEEAGRMKYSSPFPFANAIMLGVIKNVYEKQQS